METIERIHESPDVYRVVVPFDGPGIEGTNCYIVRDGADALIVDTGAAECRAHQVLELALDELGVDRSRAGFFLTHFHSDHAGLIDRIAPQDAAVYASDADLELMRRQSTDAYRADLFRRMEREGVPAGELERFKRLAFSFVNFDPQFHRIVRTADGDRIPCGRWEFEVVATPGHTAGHQSLFHRESGILFGGDLVLFAISSSVDFSPYGNDGLGSYVSSIEKVLALPATRLFHSHGELRPDWRERARWLKRHREDRLQDALSAVRSHGACSLEGRGKCFSVADGAPSGCTGYEAVRGIRWNVPFEAWEDISLMQRWCIMGEGLVYLDHLAQTGAVRKRLGADGRFRYSDV